MRSARWTQAVRKGIYGLGAGMVLAAFAPAAGALEVAVRENPRVAKEAVTLGAIARLRGDGGDLPGKAATVTVHEFGPSQTQWRVSGRAISQALWQAGISLDRVELAIPLGATVQRRTTRVGSEQVEGAIRSRLQADIPEGQRLRIDFPDGVPAFEDLALAGGLKVLPKGEEAVAVQVRDGDTVVASQRVPVAVQRQRHIAVADSELRSGHKIADGEVRMAWKTVGGDQWRHFEAAADVVDAWLRGSIEEGEPFRRSNLRLPADVRPGDPVSLIFQGDKLRLEAPGTIRQEAAVGEVTAVENRDSGERVYARLIGPNEARVVERKYSQRGTR